MQRLSALLAVPLNDHRRFSWVLDGTLVPVRDHAVAAKSKNYRWSCNAQVLIRRADLYVIAVGGGGTAIATIRSITAEQRPRTCVDNIVGCSPAVAIAEFPSSSRPCFAVGEFSGIARGGGIAGDEHASSMPLRDSRTGACFAIIARRGTHFMEIVRAVAVLHNLRIQLRHSS